jgi:hypothetical protein
MATTRITISLPDELAEALRLVAISTNESISGVAAEALARRVREAELESLLNEIDVVDGAVSDLALNKARALIQDAQRSKTPKPKKRRTAA